MPDILKAKIKNDKEGLHKLIVEYADRISDSNSKQQVECNMARLHPDLLKAFKDLEPHLARMTYMLDEKGQPHDVMCRGFSLRGEDDTHGVVLSGYRTLPNGKTFNFNAPFMRFSEDGNYGHLEELHKAVLYVEDEVKAFLFSDKIATDPQGDLFKQQSDGLPGDDKFIVQSETTKKQRGKKEKTTE